MWLNNEKKNTCWIIQSNFTHSGTVTRSLHYTSFNFRFELAFFAASLFDGLYSLVGSVQWLLLCSLFTNESVSGGTINCKGRLILEVFHHFYYKLKLKVHHHELFYRFHELISKLFPCTTSSLEQILLVVKQYLLHKVDNLHLFFQYDKCSKDQISHIM